MRLGGIPREHIGVTVARTRAGTATYTVLRTGVLRPLPNAHATLEQAGCVCVWGGGGELKTGEPKVNH